MCWRSNVWSWLRDVGRCGGTWGYFGSPSWRWSVSACFALLCFIADPRVVKDLLQLVIFDCRFLRPRGFQLSTSLSAHAWYARAWSLFSPLFTSLAWHVSRSANLLAEPRLSHRLKWRDWFVYSSLCIHAHARCFVRADPASCHSNRGAKRDP